MNRQQRTNKKKKGMVIAAILAVAIIAGSLAYWNQTHTIENPFETGKKYGATIIESFTPEEDWQPGVKVDKAVQVVNTGDQEIIVRIKMDETWVRKGEETPYKAFNATPDGDVYKVGQISATDGLTAKDASVVIKNFSESSNWIDGKDGWFYYKTNLEEGKTTDRWLTSVELLDDLDIGAQKVLHYVTTEEKLHEETKWIQYDPAEGMPRLIGTAPVLHNKAELVYEQDDDGNDLIGYLDSDYTLTITTQTVQATKEAVLEIFAFTAEELNNLPVSWKFADSK